LGNRLIRLDRQFDGALFELSGITFRRGFTHRPHLSSGPSVRVSVCPEEYNHITVSGNSAGDQGGGIFLADFGPAILTNSTISGNTAFSEGGGIWSRGVTELTHTIVGGNTALDDAQPTDCFGPLLISRGHNLVGTGTGCPRLIHTTQTAWERSHNIIRSGRVHDLTAPC
jgi:predicted outer membrane repeat protein